VGESTGADQFNVEVREVSWEQPAVVVDATPPVVDHEVVADAGPVVIDVPVAEMSIVGMPGTQEVTT